MLYNIRKFFQQIRLSEAGFCSLDALLVPIQQCQSTEGNDANQR